MPVGRVEPVNHPHVGPEVAQDGRQRGGNAFGARARVELLTDGIGERERRHGSPSAFLGSGHPALEGERQDEAEHGPRRPGRVAGAGDEERVERRDAGGRSGSRPRAGCRGAPGGQRPATAHATQARKPR